MTTTVPDRATVAHAKHDPIVFAQALIGEPLWPHQADVVRSRARIRTICSGRQAGKSRTLANEALFTAFTKPGALVLLVSAGDQASKDLLAHVSGLATAPWLGGSVVDDTKQVVTLSNGSEIRSVPASMRQIRGLAVDLLILDEACWIDNSIWTAARFAIIARPGSRVLATSTPYGRMDHWFAVTYRAGLEATRVEDHESFNWPSTASPLVDRELLELWRKTSTDREYRTEVEAEWVDDQGAYFTSAELDVACIDYPLTPPTEADGRPGIAGVDWGFATDANALVLLADDPELTAEADAPGQVWSVPWLVERFNTPYHTFISEIAAAGDARAGYRFRAVVSEMNGVGAMPTQELQGRLSERGCAVTVDGVNTTARSKEDSFGWLKTMMQQDRLALPRHPALLRQLSSLEFETTETGTMRIAVPERSGHDDLAMALCLAAHGVASNGGSAGRYLEALARRQGVAVPR